MNRFEREALDRHITGNYGEDQYRDERSGPDICGHPLPDDDDEDRYCINAYPCAEHPVQRPVWRDGRTPPQVYDDAETHGAEVQDRRK